jgi:hypothetical protein
MVKAITLNISILDVVTRAKYELGGVKMSKNYCYVLLQKSPAPLATS